MKIHEATETAYKNGYEDGKRDAVKHGRWLPQRLLGQDIVDCSECKTLGSPHWKWCPLCGARMDGDGNA